MRRVIIYADAQAVADATGARLGLVISDAIATRGVAHVVLTGGTVGVELLRSLASSPLIRLIDWTSVHVWWGDERFVPAGHPDRNELEAQHALLSKVPLPEENIHRIGGSDQYHSAALAASAYYSEIANEGGDPRWDVALFGMGPDGHVASLFPGHPDFILQRDTLEPEWTGTMPRAVAVLESPKPPSTRVTMTLSTINRARAVWIVAAGEGKADAVARAIHGDTDLPAAWIKGTAETLWLIDAAASTAI